MLIFHHRSTGSAVERAEGSLVRGINKLTRTLPYCVMELCGGGGGGGGKLGLSLVRIFH